MSYEIEFYRRPNGRCPFEEFLREVDTRYAHLSPRIVHGLRLLKDYGPEVTEPHVKSMGGGLYELRSKADVGISRAFYFFFSGDKIVMLNGFIKKTQKTPAGELEKARRYKKEYEAEHG